jgi:flagellar hook protein FlgE
VCESARYEELAVILGGQLDGDVFAERGRSAPYIDGDVQNPTLNDPGSTNVGLIQSQALEDSNVDLTGELVNMITAQRYYQANAQTIKVHDQVLQSLMQMR